MKEILLLNILSVNLIEIGHEDGRLMWFSSVCLLVLLKSFIGETSCSTHQKVSSQLVVIHAFNDHFQQLLPLLSYRFFSGKQARKTSEIFDNESSVRNLPTVLHAYLCTFGLSVQKNCN